MVQINWFAGQKLRHRRREQTYGHQGGGSRLGVVTLSWVSKEGLEQEEESESGFEGCGKDQIKLMLGLAALGH